jgi:hypothetical protein
LKYLVENGYEINESDLNSSARNGNLDCFEFLVKNYKNFNNINCNIGILAAEIGHLSCLKYLHENNYYIFESTRARPQLLNIFCGYLLITPLCRGFYQDVGFGARGGGRRRKKRVSPAQREEGPTTRRCQTRPMRT